MGLIKRGDARRVSQLRRLQVDEQKQQLRLTKLSANNQVEEEKRTLETLQKKITDDKALRGIKLQIARIDHQMKLGEQAHVAVVQASTEHVAEEAVEQALTQTMMLDEKLKVQRQRAKIELSKARTSEQGNAARAKLDEVNLQIAQNRQKRETLLGKLQVERVLIETEQAGKESAITNKKYEITEEELEQAMEKSDVLSQKHVYGLLYEAGKLRLQQVELGKKQIELEAAKAGAVGTDAQRESAQELAKITQQIADLKRQEQTIRTRVAQNTEAAKVREAEAQANTAEAVASAKRGTLSNTLTISEQRKKQSILTTEAMEAAKAFRKEADPVQQQILAARLARMELAGSPTGVADDELVTITNYDGWNENYEISFSLYKDLVKAIEAGNVSDDDLVREMVTTPLDHSDSQFAQNPEDAREVVQAIREMLSELPARRVSDAFPPSSGPLNVPLHSAPPPAPLETPPLSKTLELPRDPDGFPYDLSRSVLTLPDPASGEWMQASEYTETVSGDEIGGRPGFFYNIPTIWDGGIRSSEESRRRAHKRLQAGWEFPSYRTLGDAVAGARRRSRATPLERMHQPSALTQERVGEVRSRLNLRPEPGSQPVPSEPGYAKAEGRDFGQAVEHGAYSLQASLDRYMGDAAKARYLEEREWMEANPGTMWSKPWDERTEHEQYRTWNHAGRHGFRPLTAQEQEEGVLPFDEGLQHRYAEAERMESLARDTAFRPMNFDEVENLSDFLLYGKTAVGSSLPATAVGMVSGGVLSPFLLTAEVNDHLREIPDLPLDTRLRYAKTGGAIAGALEVVGLRVLALGIPHELLGRLGVPAIHAHIEKNLSSRLAGRFLTSAAAEGLTELGQEDTFIQTEQLAGKEFQPGEKAFRRREALLQGALAGGPMGTAMAAPKAVAQEAGLVEPDPLPPDPEHELAMQQAWEGIRRQLQLEVSLDSSAPSLTETLVEPVPGMELEGVPESMKEPESEVDAVDIAGALRSLTEPPTAEVEPVPFEATSLVEAFQPVAEPEPEPVAESEPDPEPVVHDAPA